ncbi:MAG: hypothetical protein JWQ40_1178 [Segetibacter sp.]|jgi:hypothetical protein|nr:hypothetical protein [Segetibacter sp.]
MKKHLFLLALIAGLTISTKSYAQIDFNNLRPADVLGKVIKVDKGFSPKFYVGNLKIPKVDKLGEILGMKNNPEINKLYKTFKTGRTVFQIASYAGTAITIYGLVRKVDAAAETKDYKAALVTGVTTIGTGVIVKLLTKGASYKAIDIFNNTVRNKLKDIFKIGAASETIGVGLYVKL